MDETTAKLMAEAAGRAQRSSDMLSAYVINIPLKVAEQQAHALIIAVAILSIALIVASVAHAYITKRPNND